MRTFNYSEIKKQKWDSDVLSLIAAYRISAAFTSETGGYDRRDSGEPCNDYAGRA